MHPPKPLTNSKKTMPQKQEMKKCTRGATKETFIKKIDKMWANKVMKVVTRQR